jgi:hypothetical protein
MRLPLCVLGLLLGCAGGDGDSYPPLPGTGGSIGGGGGGGSGDAGIDGPRGDAAVAIGRVCLLTDLRFPTSCAGSLGAGVTAQVRRGDAVITPGADGRFTLPASGTVGDRWLVTGTNLVSSVVPFTPGAPVLLPVVAQATWDAVRLASDIPQLPGLGALHITSRRPNGLPQPNVTVLASPAGSSVPLYAGASSTSWTGTPGTSGVAIVPNLIADQSVDIVGDSGGTPVNRATLVQQPVAADSITFLGLDFLQ